MFFTEIFLILQGVLLLSPLQFRWRYVPIKSFGSTVLLHNWFYYSFHFSAWKCIFLFKVLLYTCIYERWIEFIIHYYFDRLSRRMTWYYHSCGTDNSEMEFEPDKYTFYQSNLHVIIYSEQTMYLEMVFRTSHLNPDPKNIFYKWLKKKLY